MNNPITAAMVASIGAPAPAQTVTVTWANGTRATYSADMLDMLRTDPAALDIQDDSTGEMIYIKPDPTPTENAPQAAAEAHQRHTGGQLLTIYHRSTRPGVTIQASTFYRDRSGNWTASSHHNINRPEDIELHPGQYLTITKGA